MPKHPYQYTDTDWPDVQMPETTERFGGEEHLWTPWKSWVHSPNMKQFRDMFKEKDQRHRFIDPNGTRYLQVATDDAEAYYFCLKKGSLRYPQVGDKLTTNQGQRLKVTGSWITPDSRATGLVYLKKNNNKINLYNTFSFYLTHIYTLWNIPACTVAGCSVQPPGCSNVVPP